MNCLLKHTDLVNIDDIVFILTKLINQKCKITGDHSYRVGQFSGELARLYNLPANEIDLIKSIGPLHDIGKIGIPNHILNKPGSLTSDEFKKIKTHTTIGYDILKNTGSADIDLMATICYEHHEKWDGTGYPLGKRGMEIHLYSRIIAIADVFDALLSRRTYKEQWDICSIQRHFKQQSGKHFDPKLTNIFLRNFNEFVKLHEKLSPQYK